MRRQPKQQRSKLMVETIIEAGFICIAKHGMENTTTRHIADIAGISVGTLYQYFVDKEAVYGAMHKHYVDELSGLIRSIVPEIVHKSVRDGVKVLLYQFGEWLNKNDGRYLKYSQYSSQHGPGSIAKIEKVLVEISTQYIMHNPNYMGLKNMSTIAYITINGGAFSLVRYLSSPSPYISFEQLVDGLANMVAGYVKIEME